MLIVCLIQLVHTTVRLFQVKQACVVSSFYTIRGKQMIYSTRFWNQLASIAHVPEYGGKNAEKEKKV